MHGQYNIEIRDICFSILVGSVSSYMRACIANMKLLSVLSKF